MLATDNLMFDDGLSKKKKKKNSRSSSDKLAYHVSGGHTRTNVGPRL